MGTGGDVSRGYADDLAVLVDRLGGGYRHERELVAKANRFLRADGHRARLARGRDRLAGRQIH